MVEVCVFAQDRSFEIQIVRIIWKGEFESHLNHRCVPLFAAPPPAALRSFASNNTQVLGFKFDQESVFHTNVQQEKKQI